MKIVATDITQLIWAFDEGRKILDAGHACEISVQRFRQPKTLPQLGKIHSMFAEIARHTGHSPKHIKEIMKSEFGLETVVEFVHGEVSVRKTVSKSLADYTAEEMSFFIDQVDEWMARWEVPTYA